MAYANNTYNQVDASTYLYHYKNKIDISDMNTYSYYDVIFQVIYLYRIKIARYKEIDFIMLIYIYLCSTIGRMTHFQDRF